MRTFTSKEYGHVEVTAEGSDLILSFTHNGKAQSHVRTELWDMPAGDALPLLQLFAVNAIIKRALEVVGPVTEAQSKAPVRNIEVRGKFVWK